MPIRFASLLRSSFSYTRIRKYSALAQKATLQQEPIPISPEQLISRRLDPFSLISPELNHLRSCLISLLGSAHPGLPEIAECYFSDPKKQLRASVALLVAKATNGLGECWHKKQLAAARETSSSLGERLDRPLQVPDVLYEQNPNMTDETASFSDVFRLRRPNVDQLSPSCSPPPPSEFLPPSDVISSPSLLPTQIRLAQIAEMIHVASLLHDYISPSTSSDTVSRDGISNKLAILGGDFLLGRASTALSQLGESEVVELIASVISNQVEGEILRMNEVQTPELGLVKGPSSWEEAWDIYLKQLYLKTASLVAKSARGAVVLGGSRNVEIWKDVAYAYGRNIGIAHKLSEDASAFDVGLSDVRPGTATAPMLFAWEEHPELLPYIRRKFIEDGDLENTLEYVYKSSGIERTRALARVYAQKAQDTLHFLPESDTKLGLSALATAVVDGI